MTEVIKPGSLVWVGFDGKDYVWQAVCREGEHWTFPSVAFGHISIDQLYVPTFGIAIATNEYASSNRVDYKGFVVMPSLIGWCILSPTDVILSR